MGAGYFEFSVFVMWCGVCPWLIHREDVVGKDFTGCCTQRALLALHSYGACLIFYQSSSMIQLERGQHRDNVRLCCVIIYR